MRPARFALAAALAWLGAGCHDFAALSSQYGESGDLRLGLDLGPPQDDLAPGPDMGGSCVDGVRNGAESDIDCGGPACAKCPVGGACVTGADCMTAMCGANGRCVLPAASCRDGVKDGNESDLDCGGACPKCMLGRFCNGNSDCVGGACSGGRCAPGVGLALSFNVPTSFSSGARADRVVAGDFNKDGKLDLAVLNTDAAQVIVLLNNGQGVLVPSSGPSTGATPDGMTVGDVDSDGNLDLILLHAAGGLPIGLLRGAGNGTFLALQTFGDVNVNSIVMADVSGDGRNDEIYTVSGGTAVNVALGTAGGGIGAPKAYPTGMGASSVVSADFDGDGYRDLAAVNTVDRTVSVLLNTTAAPGTFKGAATSAALANAPGALVAGNLDSESKPDLAFLAAGGLFVMANSGTGSFGAPTPVPLSSLLLGLALGDMDLDGKLDIVYTASPGLVGVLPGNGNLSFRSPVEYAADAFADNPLVADFSGDSRLDVAVGFRNSSLMKGGVNLLAQAADGALHAAVAYSLGKECIWGAGGDFNSDGRIDLAIADHGSATAGTVNVSLGGANATLGASTLLGAGAKPAGVAVADIDANGTLDIAVGSEGQNATPGAVTILTGAGNGTFSFKASYNTGNNSRFVAFADVNNDGDTDLLVAVSGVVGAADAGKVKVLLNDGAGNFSELATLLPGTNPRTLVAADFDGDSKLDLAVANTGSNDVGIQLGNGDGTFSPPVAFPAGVTGVFGVVAVDLNGDGDLDLVVSGQVSNNVAVLMGAGAGLFRQPVTFATPAAPRELTVADFNLDGVPDLAVAGNVGGIGVLIGNGFGALQPFVTFPAGSALFAPVVQDFNADGKPDIAMVGTTRTTVILNTSH